MIGERLRELRKNKKMNQEELAVILGVDNSAISQYESNKNDPSDKIKVEIARFFDVSLDYLLGLIDKQVPYFKEDQFINLPSDTHPEERKLISEFLKFIVYRRNLR